MPSYHVLQRILLLLLLAACSQQPAPGAAPGALQPPANLERAAVTRVVDGDTLDVRLNGRIERVRLIGINTPESVDPRRPVECFGRESAARAKQLLNGQTVGLEPDASQDNRDRNGRLLRFVWLDSGRLLNLDLIAEGYAFEYTFNLPYRYQAEFRRAERAAREGQLGLWSPQTCDGQRGR